MARASRRLLIRFPVAIWLILSFACCGNRSNAPAFAIEPRASSGRQPIPGLIPTPKELPGGVRWQMITLRPRGPVTAFDLSFDGRRAAFADDAIVRICDTNGFALRNALVGHTGRVRDVAWSRDAAKIATASEDGTARIWKEDGTPLAVLRGHKDRVTAVTWTRDGKQLATSSRDGTVRLWNAEGTPGLVLRVSDAPVLCVTFNADGTRLAAGDDDRVVSIWKVDGTLVAKCEGHHGAVRSIDWSSDGKLIASGCRGYVPLDGQGEGMATIRVWNADGRFIRSLEGHTGFITSVRFSPDGSQLASTAEDLTIRVWRLEDGQSRMTAPLDSDGILRWLPDGRALYASCWQRILKVGPLTEQNSSDFEQVNERARRTGLVSEQPLRFQRALWRPRSTSFSAMSMDGQLRLFDKNGRTVWTAGAGTERFGGMDFSWRPNGNEAVTAGFSNGMPFLNADGKEVRRFSEGQQYRLVQWSPDGKSIAAAEYNRVLLLSPEGRIVRTMQGHRKRIEAMAWNVDGKRLATSADDATIRIWEMSDNGSKVLDVAGGDANALDWSPDGQWLACGSDDGSWRLWTRDGREGPVQAAESEAIQSLAFSPDSRRVLIGGWEGALHLWNLGGAQPICSLIGHLGPVTSVSWSPDGKRMLSASRDNTVRIWNAESHACEVVILRMTDGSTATFSADGKLVEGKPVSLEKDLRFLVEREADGARRGRRIDVLTYSEFKKLASDSRSPSR